MTTFLITSAAYVEAELIAEFGKLPPAFLPLGNRRLFAHQHEMIAPHASRIIMSLPESFTPDATDEARLKHLGIETMYLPEHLSLGESIVYAINMAGCGHGPVAILHGDSLLTGFDYDLVDALSVSELPPPAGYRWAWARPSEDGLEILLTETAPVSDDMAINGFFAFSDGLALVQMITRNRGDFIAGLADYARYHHMTPLQAHYWFDFGHSSTYHRSRRKVTTEREFNTLTSAVRSITKSGRNNEKIAAEANWFESLPYSLRVYTPSYLGNIEEAGKFSYSLEYLHNPSLADLAVFGRLEAISWERIFASCDEVLSALATHMKHAPSVEGANGLYLEKTLHRLELLAANRGFSLDAPCRFNGQNMPSLRKIAEIVAAEIPAAHDLTLVHGDFCFSNVLYDMRGDLIRMIDPRGIDHFGRVSNLGDIRYDIAKLYHSAIGLYDHIIAGNFELNQFSSLDFTLALPNTKTVHIIQDAFLGQEFVGMTSSQASSLPIAILLFLSMPPLHSDSPIRQSALLANALRLFSIFDRNRIGE